MRIVDENAAHRSGNVRAPIEAGACTNVTQSSRREAAGRVAEDHGAIDGPGRCGGPATREAIVEELVGGRAMVPHGDRVDAPESGGVEDKVSGGV